MRTKIKYQHVTEEEQFFEEVRTEVGAYLKQHGFDGYATPPVWWKGLGYGLMAIGAYVLLLTENLPYALWLACWVVWGLSNLLVGLNIGHDAAHNALSANRRLNKVLFYISFNTLGTNAYLWGLRHVQSHHLFPNVDGCDADIDDNWILRLSPNRPLYRFHRYQQYYAPVLYLFYSLIWVFYKDYAILRKKQLANLRDIRHPRTEIGLFYMFKALYVCLALLLPYLLSGFTFGQVLTGFLLMHFAVSYAFILGLIGSHFSDEASFEQVGQNGFLPHSWALHQLITSVDYEAQKTWANAIFGGFNAHAAHHLFPRICHIHYPKISAIIEEKCREHSIPYKNLRFAEAVRAHFRYLRKMGNINALPEYSVGIYRADKNKPFLPFFTGPFDIICGLWSNAFAVVSTCLGLLPR